MHLSGRRGEVQLLGERNEVAKVTQFHESSSRFADQPPGPEAGRLPPASRRGPSMTSMDYQLKTSFLSMMASP
jgi:hypothetical protein